jgi:phosphatidate cytidylyltransferase
MQQRQRVITAAVCIPLFLLLIYLGGWWLGTLMLILTGIGGWEFYRLLERIKPQTFLFWMLLGCGYIALGFACFYGIRVEQGVLWLLLIVWTNDTAAYEVGRRIGKTRLAPSVSPNKTWEGAIAGVIGALIIGFIYGVAFMKVGVGAALLIPVFMAVLADIGDLLESKIKRLARVKDSGSVFPGHGGVLDRFDSLLLTAPFMYFLLFLIS